MDSELLKSNFGAADISIFAGTLLLACVVGIYYAYKDRNTFSTGDYYFGGNQMHPIAVGLSMAVTFQSSVAMIAEPVEVYIVGDMMLWMPIVLPLITPITYMYFIPFFHRLHTQTIFELLEMRFNTATKNVAAALTTLGTIFYLGTVLYLPAIALSAVTPIPVSSSIVLTSVICTFYTTLGGMKAVIWTDVLQSSVMALAIAAVFIRGVFVIGGFSELSDSLERGQRYTIFKFETGITSRISPIAAIFGGLSKGISFMNFSQPMMQRIRSCKNVMQARGAIVVCTVITFLILMISYGNGFLMYAYFEGCDPVLSGKLTKIDQGIPYMALEIFQSTPGMGGLIVAAIFSGGLSTISSQINSVSMVVLEDIIAPIRKNMAQKTKLRVGKVVAVFIGLLAMMMAFIMTYAKSNILKILFGYLGLIYGPLTGVFILSFFVPWANSKGAIAGALISFGFSSFLFVTSNFLSIAKKDDALVPNTIDSCPFNITSSLEMNTTQTTTISASATDDGNSFLQVMASINYHFYQFIGASLSVTIGILFSFLTGPNTPAKADPSLFIPLVDNKRLPANVRKFFRFGVPEVGDGMREGTPNLNTEHKENERIEITPVA